MNFALAVFVVVGFAATIEYFDLPDRARTVGERSSRSLAVLRDDSLGGRIGPEPLLRVICFSKSRIQRAFRACKRRFNSTPDSHGKWAEKVGCIRSNGRFKVGKFYSR